MVSFKVWNIKYYIGVLAKWNMVLKASGSGQLHSSNLYKALENPQCLMQCLQQERCRCSISMLDSLYNHVLHPNQSPRLHWNDSTKKLTTVRPWKIVGCSLGVGPQGSAGKVKQDLEDLLTVVTVMFVANTTDLKRWSVHGSTSDEMFTVQCGIDKWEHSRNDYAVSL